jgi:hypothetical protein
MVSRQSGAYQKIYDLRMGLLQQAHLSTPCDPAGQAHRQIAFHEMKWVPQCRQIYPNICIQA